VVNGQTAKKELVKVLTRGHSCDYRVYGSDTPLECTASTSTKYGIQLHSNKVVGRFGILHSPGVMESVTTWKIAVKDMSTRYCQAVPYVYTSAVKPLIQLGK